MNETPMNDTLGMIGLGNAGSALAGALTGALAGRAPR